jgi:hypothetical protein
VLYELAWIVVCVCSVFRSVPLYRTRALTLTRQSIHIQQLAHIHTQHTEPEWVLGRLVQGHGEHTALHCATIPLFHVSICCNTFALHAIHTALHYTTLHYTTLHYTTLHCTTPQDVNGSDITRTTDDLSISFHLINYLHGMFKCAV